MSIHIELNDIQTCILYDNTVLTTLTNYGYILYTLNMLKSLQPFGLDKRVLIICIDEQCASIFKKKGYCVISIDNNKLGRFCPWNSKGYDKICYLKLELIHCILSLKMNVLLLDGDIVFRKNPIDDISLWQLNYYYDVWIQNDSQNNNDITNMCTGYMFIKSSDSMCALYDCVSENGRQKYIECAFDNNDQSYFNKYVKPFCKMNALPLEKYPNGKMFYAQKDSIINTAILVHFNWVHGHIKMAKMKEHRMWLLTPEEEDAAVA